MVIETAVMISYALLAGPGLAGRDAAFVPGIVCTFSLARRYRTAVRVKTRMASQVRPAAYRVRTSRLRAAIWVTLVSPQMAALSLLVLTLYAAGLTWLAIRIFTRTALR